MPVSGLVVTLVKDGAAHRAALSALRAHPCITVHESFTAAQTADLPADLPADLSAGLSADLSADELPADLCAGPAGDMTIAQAGDPGSARSTGLTPAQPMAGQGDGGRSTALRVPIVIDARDAAEEEAVWQWLQDLEGVVFTDLVCSLGDELAASAEPTGADGPARLGSADPQQQTPPASALSGTGSRPPCIVRGLSAEQASDLVQGQPDRPRDGAPPCYGNQQ